MMRIAVPILLVGGGGAAGHNVLAYCRIGICSGGGGYTLCGSAGLARSPWSRLGNIRPEGTEAIEIDVVRPGSVHDGLGNVLFAGSGARLAGSAGRLLAFGLWLLVCCFFWGCRFSSRLQGHLGRILSKRT